MALTAAEHRKHLRILRRIRQVCCPKCNGSPWVTCEYCHSTGVVSEAKADDFYFSDRGQP